MTCSVTSGCGVCIPNNSLSCHCTKDVTPLGVISAAIVTTWLANRTKVPAVDAPFRIQATHATNAKRLQDGSDPSNSCKGRAMCTQAGTRARSTVRKLERG
jgi:hypothetical protein